MKRIITFMAIFFSLATFAQEIMSLKVLYVGGSTDYYDPNTATIENPVQDRTDAFVNYLKSYFATVTAVDGKDYTQEMSANVDVTIFDGRTKMIQPQGITYNEKGEIDGYYQARYFSEEFDYPSIIIAETAEHIGRAIGLKADWYCLCLDAHAHNFNTQHQIFKGPFPVTMTITDRPTPEDAFHYEYFTGKLPATTPMWRVQTKGYMTDDNFRVGMVARPWGFLDSPDCEVISSGVCAKTIDAVAIGRHGNFFFWGFSASPKYMTDEAKQVFANAVVYTSTLKGEKILARKYMDRRATKEYTKELLYLVTREAYEEGLESDKQFYQEQREMQKEIKARKERGEKLKRNEERLLSINIDEEEKSSMVTYEEYLKKRLRGDFEYGGTVEGYCKVLNEDRDYIYGNEEMYMFSIDKDCKALGIANTDKKLLDRAISMLEKGENIEMADRILDRYTLCTFTEPSEWRKWYETYKDKLFFTQTGGWVFMVNSTDSNVPGNDYKKREFSRNINIEVKEPTPLEPVTSNATLFVRKNGEQYVVVKAKILVGSHIYEYVSDKDPYIASMISAALPEGYTADELQAPFGKPFNSTGTTIYENEVVFVLPINGVGDGTIKVTFRYQCCDSQSCSMPQEKVFELKTILSKRR